MASTADFPDPFPVDTGRRPQTLQLAQAVGAIVKPHLDWIVVLSIVEFQSRCHAPIQKISSRNESIW